jgi:hypothetical protein
MQEHPPNETKSTSSSLSTKYPKPLNAEPSASGPQEPRPSHLIYQASEADHIIPSGSINPQLQCTLLLKLTFKRFVYLLMINNVKFEKPFIRKLAPSNPFGHLETRLPIPWRHNPYRIPMVRK